MAKPFPSSVYLVLSEDDRTRAIRVNEAEYHNALLPTPLVREIFRAGLTAIEKGHLSALEMESQKPNTTATTDEDQTKTPGSSH